MWIMRIVIQQEHNTGGTETKTDSLVKIGDKLGMSRRVVLGYLGGRCELAWNCG